MYGMKLIIYLHSFTS